MVVVVGVDFVRDLSIAMRIGESEVVKLSMTGEVVSNAMERTSSLSKPCLLDIVATCISEYMHGIDDILSHGFIPGLS